MTASTPCFDVTCLSFGRVGTVSVGGALLSHSGLAMGTWRDDHRRIVTQQPTSFTEPSQNKLSLQTLHHQSLLHREQRQLLDRVIVAGSKKFIHLVREPASLLLGWYNHIVESASLGINQWQSPGTLDDFLKGENAIMETLYHERIAQQFYGQCRCEDIHLVEFNQLNKETFSNTIEGILAFLGLSHEPVSFNQPLNDLTTKLLYRGMTVRLNGESVKLVMIPADGATGDPGRDYIACMDGVGAQMARHAPLLRPIEGKIYIGFSPQVTELKKSTYELLRQHQAEIFGPAMDGWIKNAQILASQIIDRQQHSLSPQQAATLWRRVGQDTSQFVSRYPQLRDRWQYGN